MFWSKSDGMLKSWARRRHCNAKKRGHGEFTVLFRVRQLQVGGGWSHGEDRGVFTWTSWLVGPPVSPVTRSINHYSLLCLQYLKLNLKIMSTSSPFLGEPTSTHPALAPSREKVLQGKHVTLTPLLKSHQEELAQNVGGPGNAHLYTYLPDMPDLESFMGVLAYPSLTAWAIMSSDPRHVGVQTFPCNPKLIDPIAFQSRW